MKDNASAAVEQRVSMMNPDGRTGVVENSHAIAWGDVPKGLPRRACALQLFAGAWRRMKKRRRIILET